VVVVALLLGLLLTRYLTLASEQGVGDDTGNGEGASFPRIKLRRKDEIGIFNTSNDQFADNLSKYVVKRNATISEGNINIETPIMDEKDEIGPP